MTDKDFKGIKIPDLRIKIPFRQNISNTPLFVIPIFVQESLISPAHQAKLASLENRVADPIFNLRPDPDPVFKSIYISIMLTFF